jgi:hypothetical protein
MCCLSIIALFDLIIGGQLMKEAGERGVVANNHRLAKQQDDRRQVRYQVFICPETTTKQHGRYDY